MAKLSSLLLAFILLVGCSSGLSASDYDKLAREEITKFMDTTGDITSKLQSQVGSKSNPSAFTQGSEELRSKAAVAKANFNRIKPPQSREKVHESILIFFESMETSANYLKEYASTSKQSAIDSAMEFATRAYLELSSLPSEYRQK